MGTNNEVSSRKFEVSRAVWWVPASVLSLSQHLGKRDLARSMLPNTKNSRLGLKQDGRITYWRLEVATLWFPEMPFSDFWLLRCLLWIRKETKAERDCPETVQSRMQCPDRSQQRWSLDRVGERHNECVLLHAFAIYSILLELWAGLQIMLWECNDNRWFQHLWGTTSHEIHDAWWKQLL